MGSALWLVKLFIVADLSQDSFEIRLRKTSIYKYRTRWVKTLLAVFRQQFIDIIIAGDVRQFAEVRELTDQWIELYNHERPHDGLNDMTPAEYLNTA
jgi:transposase InsO family protein